MYLYVLLQTFQAITEEAGVKYDPKTGFTLNLQKSNHSFGRYKCDTEIEDDEVNFILERGVYLINANFFRIQLNSAIV